MIFHWNSLSLPGFAPILKVADQLPFLAVHADDGVACIGKGIAQLADVLELPIPILGCRRIFDAGFNGLA